MNVVMAIFVFSALYSMLGNLVAYIVLVNRDAEMRFMWVGIPGYLYRVCLRTPGIGKALQRFVVSTDVALIAVVASGIGVVVAANV